MNFNVVKKEIDKWDPINLLMCSPQDEYDYESKEISLRFQCNVEQSGHMIYEVFSNTFGCTFTKSVDECICIAKKIMEHSKE